MALKDWLGPMRGPFLLLTPACMALAIVLAWLSAEHPGSAWGWRALLALIGALSAHISVNALNEYADFRSGLDQQTQRTPFSGGSGTLPANPALASTALWTGLISLTLTGAIGLGFLASWPGAALELAPLGLIGLMLIVAYTPWVTRRPWVCLMAPGLGFGPLMIVGTQLALNGHATPMAWLSSLVPFFLVNNLLLLNQFPDVEADRAVGRVTLPILLGKPASARILGLQWLTAYAGLLVMVLTGAAPVGAALGLSSLPLAWASWQGVRRHMDDIPALLPAMGMNVGVCLLTPVLMAVGLTWVAR